MGRLRRLLPRMAWPALALSLGACAYFTLAWQQLRHSNRLITDPHLIESRSLPEDPAVRYAAAWQHERAGHLEPALESYAIAEGADDPALAARAKFGMGNLYFQIGLRAGDIAAGGSHVRGLAQLELAREAYRSALRLDPELRDARYNLELLERMSPQRRLEGWSRAEENLRLRQGEEQGWAAMKEGNVIRGLP